MELNIFLARQIYSPLRRLNLTPTSSSEICAGTASVIMHFLSSRCTAFQQVLALDWGVSRQKTSSLNSSSSEAVSQMCRKSMSLASICGFMGLYCCISSSTVRGKISVGWSISLPWL